MYVVLTRENVVLIGFDKNNHPVFKNIKQIDIPFNLCNFMTCEPSYQRKLSCNTNLSKYLKTSVFRYIHEIGEYKEYKKNCKSISFLINK